MSKEKINKDEQKNTNEKVCIILLSLTNNKVAFVCGITKNLTDSLSAKDVVSNLSGQINGKGGGRADFAQGAGEANNFEEFVNSIPDIVQSIA